MAQSLGKNPLTLCRANFEAKILAGKKFIEGVRKLSNKPLATENPPLRGHWPNKKKVYLLNRWR
jgi:hypothetical protein